MAEFAPDLVFIDQTMPGLDGLTTSRVDGVSSIASAAASVWVRACAAASASVSIGPRGTRPRREEATRSHPPRADT